MDGLHQDFHGLLVFGHFLAFNYDLKRVFIKQAHKFLVVKSERLIVAVLDHQVEDLD